MAVGFVNGGLRIDELASGTLMANTEFSTDTTCYHTATIGANITININASTKVRECILFLTDDAGGRTLTYGATLSAPTGTQVLASGKKYLIRFIRDGVIWYTGGAEIVS